MAGEKRLGGPSTRSPVPLFWALLGRWNDGATQRQPSCLPGDSLCWTARRDRTKSQSGVLRPQMLRVFSVRSTPLPARSTEYGVHVQIMFTAGSNVESGGPREDPTVRILRPCPQTWGWRLQKYIRWIGCGQEYEFSSTDMT